MEDDLILDNTISQNGKKEKPFVQIRGLTKKFGAITAVDNIDLDIYQGELFCLLGGSGCGKSTLLRMLAGFEFPESGSISIDGIDMSQVPAYERPTNMMFQSYALFPHMTVHRRSSVLNVHGAGIHAEAVTFDDAFIKNRSRLIGLAIDARRQRFPDEIPYEYAPDANGPEKPVWNDAIMPSLKNYNLTDLSI